VLQFLAQKDPVVKHLSNESRDFVKLWQQRDKLIIESGVLFRKTEHHEKLVKQMVIPMEYRNRILKGIYDDMGHPGRDKTLLLAKTRFYWPGITVDIENHVRVCRRCICRKSKTVKAPLHPVLTSRPLELLCIDYLLVEPSAGYEHLLVITDHFTKFARVVPTKNESAKTTAKVLYEFMNMYGYPDKIHSDQGRTFESNIVKELCKLSGIAKSRTTPYHPMSNGACERMNQTILKMLGTLANDKKSNWKQYLNALVSAYNCTPHETTSFSPYELMFGRSPHIALDVELGLDVNGNSPDSYCAYVENIRKQIEYCQKLAKESMESIATKAKSNYDPKRVATSLEIGDHVLVRKVGFQERHKLSDKWEDVTYIVVGIPCENIPVYEVQPVGQSKSRVRTVHRNMLLPLGKKLFQDKSSNVVEDGADTESEISDNSVDTDPIRKSKRVKKPVDRLQVGHMLVKDHEISDDSADNYVKKRDFALMLFDKVFPT
jgi:transposase InsO family protein